MTNFNVSVIIPVYEGERFLKIAIDSVLIQKEVSEIVLIEDGSKDNSLELCFELQKKYPDKIKVYYHKNNTNQGASISRNLGIEMASNEFISFLDVDDYYIENRFLKAKELLSNDDSIDGVYEAIGTHYYDEYGKELHSKRMTEINIRGLRNDLTTLTKEVPPEKLFESLIMGNIGWFHFNGLTLRKSCVKKSGLLNPNLWYGEDIEFFLRLSIFVRLIPGRLNEAVAMRGVYAGNSTLSIYTSYKTLFINQHCTSYRWRIMFELMLKSNFSIKINRFLFNRYIDYYDYDIIKHPVNLRRKFKKFFLILLVVYREPKSYSKIIG